MEIPKGHQAVMPYIMLNNAPGFIEFAKNVFGAESTFTRYREGTTTIMHAELQINGSTLMICEATTEWQPHNASLFVYVADADNTYRKAVELGAGTIMELSDQSYGRTCGVTDPFGNIWWITSVQ